MPDDGASMADIPPTDSGKETAAGVQRDTKEVVQDKPMPEYEIEQREEESANIVRRASRRGEDDGTDQVFGPDDRPPKDAGGRPE